MKKHITFIILLFSIITIRLMYIVFFNEDKYLNKLKEKTDINIYGASAPRGKILDVNGKIIVDNDKINTIFYH